MSDYFYSLEMLIRYDLPEYPHPLVQLIADENYYAPF